MKKAEAQAAIQAKEGTVDRDVLLKDAAAMEELRKQLDAEYEVQARMATVALFNRIEVAILEVRAKHGLPAELPPNLPEIDAGSANYAQAIYRRMVLDFDDAMEKEIIDLLNERFVKAMPPGPVPEWREFFRIVTPTAPANIP
jgi:hypothetical protein